jgi:SanA protein
MTDRSAAEPTGRGRRIGGRGRLFLRVVGVVAALGAVLVAVANVVVVRRADGAVTREPSAVRPAQAAIVPGSLVLSDGSLGAIVQQRVDAAVALYHRDLVDKILMSGDNARPEYDEPDAMRDAALAAGVAPEDVFTDYAGFSTWHTMRRARDVFQVSTAVVVTQAPYAPRSVDLARAAGLDAQVLVAGDDGGAAREVLARVRGLGEATFRPGVTGGAAIPIEGDGRTSWAEPEVAGQK